MPERGFVLEAEANIRTIIATIRAITRRRSVAEDDRIESFEAAARDHHAANLYRWGADHAADRIESLERHVFPYIGNIALTEVTPANLLGVVRSIEQAGHVETANRVRQRISEVYISAIIEGCAVTNPMLAIAGVKAPVTRTRPQPALLEPHLLREAMRAIEATKATRFTHLASRLLALTAVRSAAIRGARWEEITGIDWTTGTASSPLWRIPAERMKLTVTRKRDKANAHLVPLSRQAVEVLLAARAISGAGEWIFLGRSGPLSDSVLSALYDRAGLKGRHVPHGWLASFATIMNERHPEHRRAIDLTLAHAPKDRVEAAYNRAEHNALRRELLQEWADVLTLEGKASFCPK